MPLEFKVHGDGTGRGYCFGGTPLMGTYLLGDWYLDGRKLEDGQEVEFYWDDEQGWCRMTVGRAHYGYTCLLELEEIETGDTVEVTTAQIGQLQLRWPEEG